MYLKPTWEIHFFTKSVAAFRKVNFQGPNTEQKNSREERYCEEASGEGAHCTRGFHHAHWKEAPGEAEYQAPSWATVHFQSTWTAKENPGRSRGESQFFRKTLTISGGINWTSDQGLSLFDNFMLEKPLEIVLWLRSTQINVTFQQGVPERKVKQPTVAHSPAFTLTKKEHHIDVKAEEVRNLCTVFEWNPFNILHGMTINPLFRWSPSLQSSIPQFLNLARHSSPCCRTRDTRRCVLSPLSRGNKRGKNLRTSRTSSSRRRRRWDGFAIWSYS